MVQVYLNYPNPRIMLHGQSICGEIGKMRKVAQRQFSVNAGTIGQELQKFAAKGYRFGAAASTNDIWLSIDFGDTPFEEAVMGYVQRLLAKHYSPFAGVAPDWHCK